jgi:hypothetical protein
MRHETWRSSTHIPGALALFLTLSAEPALTFANCGVRVASAPALKFDPVPVLTVPVAVWSPTVCDYDAAGCFVVRGAAQQDAVQTNRPAVVKRGRPRRTRTSLSELPSAV